MYMWKIVADFQTHKKVNFMKNLTFANIVIMVLELKNYSVNIMIKDVWKLKDSKKKCLLQMKK